MRASPINLFLALVPAIFASCLILYVAGVGLQVMLIQAVAMLLLLGIGLLGSRFFKRITTQRGWFGVMLIAVLVCCISFTTATEGPDRWLRVGPVNLYLAPVVLPLVLVAIASLVHQQRSTLFGGLGGLVLTAFVLALQPDLSQVIALSLGVVVCCLVLRVSGVVVAGMAVLLGLAVLVAALQPDPLKPVPYVEGVFALGFEHSAIVGMLILSGAILFLVVLAKQLWAINLGLIGVVVYYASLFVLSTFGLTPAPLIGFGAGPIIGYGLMVAVLTAGWSSPRPATRET